MARVKGPAAVPSVDTARDPGVRLPEQVFADAYGYDIGTAAARFGTRGFQLAADIAKERQDQEDATFATKALTDLRVKAHDLENALKKEVGEGAANYRKLYEERYKALSEQVREESLRQFPVSKRGLEHYERRALELGGAFAERAAVYEDQERKKLFIDQTQKSVDTVGLGTYKGTISLADGLRQAGEIAENASKTLTPDEKRDLIEKSKRIISANYLNGLTERDPQAALGFIKGTKPEKLAEYGLKPADIDRADGKARAELRRRASEARMAAAIEKATLRDDAAQTVTAFMKGYNVEPAKMTDLSVRLRALGDEKTADRLDMLESMSTDLDTARRASLPDFQAWVRDLKNEAAKNPDDAQKATRAEVADSLFRAHVGNLKEDPLAYSAQLFKNEIGDLGAVNVDSPDSAAATIRDRVRASNYASQRLGIYVPPLFQDEAARLKAQIDAMPAETKTAVRGRLDDALGDDASRRRFWAMMADGSPEKRSAEAARIVSEANLARTQPGLARDIALGREARKANKNYAPSDERQFRASLDGLLGNAFSLVPEAREAVAQEILDLYAKKSLDAGDTSGQRNDDRLKEAFKQRFGGDLPEWNGVKVIPPQYGWDRARFRDWLYSLPPDLGLGRKLVDGKDRGPALPVLPSAKREITAELLARNGRLHSVGDGKYMVELKNQGGAWEFLVDPRDGRRFVLDRAAVRERGATPNRRAAPPAETWRPEAAPAPEWMRQYE